MGVSQDAAPCKKTKTSHTPVQQEDRVFHLAHCLNYKLLIPKSNNSPHPPPPKRNRIEKKNDNKKGLLFLYTQICNVPFLRVVLSPSCLSCGSIEC